MAESLSSWAARSADKNERKIIVDERQQVNSVHAGSPEQVKGTSKISFDRSRLDAFVCNSIRWRHFIVVTLFITPWPFVAVRFVSVFLCCVCQWHIPNTLILNALTTTYNHIFNKIFDFYIFNFSVVYTFFAAIFSCAVCSFHRDVYVCVCVCSCEMKVERLMGICIHNNNNNIRMYPQVAPILLFTSAPMILHSNGFRVKFGLAVCASAHHKQADENSSLLHIIYLCVTFYYDVNKSIMYMLCSKSPFSNINTTNSEPHPHTHMGMKERHQRGAIEYFYTIYIL